MFVRSLSRLAWAAVLLVSAAASAIGPVAVRFLDLEIRPIHLPLLARFCLKAHGRLPIGLGPRARKPFSDNGFAPRISHLLQFFA